MLLRLPEWEQEVKASVHLLSETANASLLFMSNKEELGANFAPLFTGIPPPPPKIQKFLLFLELVPHMSLPHPVPALLAVA